MGVSSTINGFGFVCGRLFERNTERERGRNSSHNNCQIYTVCLDWSLSLSSPIWVNPPPLCTGHSYATPTGIICWTLRHDGEGSRGAILVSRSGGVRTALKICFQQIISVCIVSKCAMLSFYSLYVWKDFHAQNKFIQNWQPWFGWLYICVHVCVFLCLMVCFATVML